MCRQNKYFIVVLEKFLALKRDINCIKSRQLKRTALNEEKIKFIFVYTVVQILLNRK